MRLARDFRPGIRAKRRGRESGAIVEIAHRIDRPRVAHRHRYGNLRAAHHDRFAVNHRLGPNKLAIFARDGKALQFVAAFAQQTILSMIKKQTNAIAFKVGGCRKSFDAGGIAHLPALALDVGLRLGALARLTMKSRRSG